MPEKGIVCKRQGEILTFEEIEYIVRAAVLIGINKVRITGGEPLVRKGIEILIERLSKIEGIKDLSMTTNGVLLWEYVDVLKEAGLKRLNISLDTLDAGKYARITRYGSLSKVLKGIEKSHKAGFTNIKINVVVIKGINDDEVMDLVEFSCREDICVRFIESMPVNKLFWKTEHYIPMHEIKQECMRRVNLEETIVSGNGPAEYYRIPGRKGTIGFISPLSCKFCSSCNRLRLTSDGKLRSCLHNNYEVELREKVRQNGSIEEVAELIREGIVRKPKEHLMLIRNSIDRVYPVMSQIGG
jgi:cyclic pyranopterin phosphate synthase